MVTLFFAAFGISCAFIRPRRTDRRWRLTWIWDVLAAIAALPLAAVLFRAVTREVGVGAGPWFFFITLPCIFGFSFGSLYAAVRRRITS
jgi:hypothetical protein